MDCFGAGFLVICGFVLIVIGIAFGISALREFINKDLE